VAEHRLTVRPVHMLAQHDAIANFSEAPVDAVTDATDNRPFQLNTPNYGWVFQFGRSSMSLSHKIGAYEKQRPDADRKHPEYSLVLALVCLALALLVISAKFTPAQVGGALSSEIPLVSP